MNSSGAEAQQGPAASQPTILHAAQSVAGPAVQFIGNTMWVKLASAQAGGAFSLMENAIAPRNGPPLHVHAFEEFFYVLQGTFLFELGGVPLNAGPGDFVHIAGNVPHVFQNISDHEGRLLLIARPGGVENYFAELGAQAVRDPRDVAAMNAIGEEYGIKILGPPIAARGERRLQ